MRTMTGHENAIGGTDAQLVLEDEMAHLRRSDAKVLISGAASIDNRAAAQFIHQRSPRAGERFVTVSCAGVSETRLEQELFGGRPDAESSSALELADRGTLFLDDVGELTPRMQAMLTQFLETGEVRRTFDGRQGRVNVRVIAATRRNLRDSIDKGAFREDLFYRLNIVHIVLTPLIES
jgi:DNA-binding NtrC family response regulator